MIKLKVNSAIIIFCFFSALSFAEQLKPDSISSKTDTISSKEINYTEGTFVSTRVINGQSTEGVTQGRLDFKIEHRFDLIKNGFSEFYGLDHANTFFGFEYGIKDWLMVGINRTSLTQAISGYTKISLLRQSTGAKNMPLSVSLLAGTSYMGLPVDNSGVLGDYLSQTSYNSQLLIARKFSDIFSAQLAPIWIHRNKVISLTNANDLFALGISATCKVSPTLSLSGEYYPVINPSVYYTNHYQNSLSFSLNVEVGGHVFQIILSNASDMIEKGFIGETTGKWMKGDIHLGFNLLRKFYL
jgi:hypothetical protein